MAASESSKSELWIITSEERAKHDALFLQQNPVGGYLSAEQAKAFFLQSGLPKQKLGQIWALADLDADGRMNHKEFSIAMHLIKKSLHGTDLPSILPPMIKMDPPPLIPAAPFPGMGVYPPFPMGAATLPRIGGPMLPLSNSGPSHIAPSGMLPTGVGPVASIGSPLNSVTLGSIGNTMPPVIQPVLTGSTLSAISKPATSLSNLPIALPTTTTSGFSYPSGSPLPLISGGMSLGLGASPASSPVTTSGSEWSIPQNSRLKYNQMFATADSSQKSFLTGVEAKAILSQYGLNQSTLAKIWSLSDIDGNGNLSRDEFCLAMHLVEMVKNGQTLPTILPSNMIPPSLRAVASRSVTSVRSSSPAIGNSIAGSTNFISPVQVAAPATTTPVKSETFSDLLSINVGRSPITAQTEAVVLPESPKYAVTFEDKRRENFEKGQAELERRRAMLEEQQKKEAEERIAFQKREEEKRERARLEQEKRRQMEMEKQLAKQRQLEQEQEEQRRKQMEQKEAARRELERQRQMEWVQQRRDQLMSEKIRHQSAVDKLRTEDTQLRLELTSMMDKSAELSEKIRQAKQDIITYTSAIEGMKARRDKTLTDIDRFQLGIDESTRKLRIAEQERIALDQQMKGTVLHHDDKLESLRNSCTTRRSTVRQLKSDLSQIEQKSQTTGHQIENYTKQLQSLKKEAMELQQDISRLEKQKSSLKARSATKTAAKKTVDDVAHQEQRVNGVSSAPASTKMERSSSIGSNQQDSVINSGVGAMSAKAENVRPGLLKYTALYDFDAQEDGELSFSVNDIISVYADSVGTQLGWLKGRDESGKTGWLPETYVAPVESVTQPTVHSVLPSEGRRESARDDGLSLPDHVTAAAVPVAANPSTSSKPVEHANSVKRLAEQLQTKLVSRVPSTENARSSPAIPDHGSRVRKDQRAIDGHSSAPVGATDTGADGSRRVKIDQRDDSTWSTSVAGVIAKSTDDSVVQDAASTVDEEQFPEGRIEIYGNISEFSKPTTDTSLNNEIHVSAVNCRKGDLCEALYDYNSEEPSDLVFVAGDVITVELADGEWWTGTIGSRTGMFPANYVRLLTPEQSGDHAAAGAIQKAATTAPSVVRQTVPAIADIAKQEADSRSINQVENDVEPTEPTLNSQSQPKSSNKRRNHKAAESKKPEIATVIAAYKATGAEQLSLEPGQLIHVLKKSSSGWWEGELQAKGQRKRVGWFPENYVKLLGQSSDSSNVTPAQTPQQDTANGYQQMQYVDQVVAKYTYDAQQEDELSFVKGAVINVLNKDDPHWWQGEVNGSVGLFPSNYITSLTETNEEPYGTIVQQQPPAVATVSMTPELEQKRQQHIDELINTEETFNKDVQTVLEVFYQPFKTDEILTEEELNTMFINWKELQNCSMKLLKALRVRAKMSGEGRPIQNVGDILCEHLPHMTPYIRFCSSQLNSAALLQKKSESDNKFKEAHRKCMQNPRTMNMPLSSFLLKPMQRITKYPLLIEKILQHTPERHPDYLNVQEALQRATELCNQVNEGVREKENSDILEWIQNHVHCDGLTERLTFNSVTNCLGPRKYLHCGVLVKVKSGKDLVGMLFNDFLLLTQPQKAVGQAASFRIDTKSNAQFKMYRNPIVLNEVMVKKPADADDPDGLLFQLSHVDRHYLLRAPTTLERDVWIKKIEAASKEYLETERKKREKAHYTRLSSYGIGRLMVVVVKGCNLKATDPDGKSDPYCEVSMGAQEHKTKVIPSCLNPKWNASMQFTIKNIQEDVLCITVYDRDLFSPNDFLGRTEIRVKDILEDTRQMKGPVTKRFLLHEVDTGEVVVKLNIQLFDIN